MKGRAALAISALPGDAGRRRSGTPRWETASAGSRTRWAGRGAEVLRRACSRRARPRATAGCRGRWATSPASGRAPRAAAAGRSRRELDDVALGGVEQRVGGVGRGAQLDDPRAVVELGRDVDDDGAPSREPSVDLARHGRRVVDEEQVAGLQVVTDGGERRVRDRAPRRARAREATSRRTPSRPRPRASGGASAVRSSVTRKTVCGACVSAAVTRPPPTSRPRAGPPAR